MIALEIFSLILLADFITGGIHWWEDTYGDPSWKYLGKLIVVPNIEHHQFPRKFLNNSFWGRIRLSFIFGLLLIGVFAIFDAVTWQLILLFAYAALANECHAASHRTDKENGIFIRFIQTIGLIQSRKMHGHHHTAPYSTNYCIQTNYLNPILNTIRFWTILETIIAWFGIKPTRGQENRNGY